MVYERDFAGPVAMFVVDDFGNDLDIYFEPCYNEAQDFIESDQEI